MISEAELSRIERHGRMIGAYVPRPSKRTPWLALACGALVIAAAAILVFAFVGAWLSVGGPHA